MADVTIIVAFLAGIVSFASPCVLPIIPGFLSYLAGSSLKDAKQNRWDIFINSAFFVLGFSLVFSALGVLLNTILEKFAYDAQAWLARIGGAMMIFFGLYLLGLVRIPFLETEHKAIQATKLKSRYLTSLLFGAGFAAGWTPCVSSALGAILGLAASHPGTAFYLLMAYTLGLGVPFLAVGLFTTQASEFIRKNAQNMAKLSKVFGVVLIALGVLVFTQQLSRVANFDILNKILLG
ncbi:MAG: sulfite exporter TauE/SafE family protein [Candidatus Aenigmarchaeota archaeon]|nr:sulfite exporter TauE/SafE family protein [Candidatus Aenigmarchaeota archaeon]